MELVWACWVVGIAVTFGLAEAFAIRNKRPTLSRTVWDITAAWPPLGWAAGVVVGFLACHFFWPAEGCPPLH